MIDKQTLPTPDHGLLRDAHVFLLITLVACIIYAKSIFYQYTYFDDAWFLVLNHKTLSNLANIPKLFTTDVFISFRNPEAFYRPFLNLLFMLELQVSGGSLAVFHITNILLHVGCSLLLFAVFKQLKLSRVIAAAAALLFCAHPLNTSAVVWIPGRNDSLLTLVVLGSFSLFLRALDTRRLAPLIGHLLLFFLALLTKETAIVLPILCIAYAVWVRREKMELKKSILIITGYMLPLALWLILRSSVAGTSVTNLSLGSLALNCLKTSPAFLLYVGKAFLPFNLSVLPNLNDTSLLLGVISVLAIVAAFFIHRPSSLREFGWGVGWFFLFLAPTFLSSSILYEHRAYCAFVGLVFALVQLPLVQSIDFMKNSRILEFIVILTIYSAVAMLHSEHFRNRTAFAASAYSKDPSVDASHAAVADLFLTEGNDKEAERVLKLAIARDSSMRLVHRRLADIYANRHDYALAAGEYETSIRIDPFDLYAYIDYGRLCLETGRLDDAGRLWKRSVEVNPEFLVGYQYLATFYTYNKHAPDSAMIYMRQLQQRGVTLLPEMRPAIENNRSYGERKQ